MFRVGDKVTHVEYPDIAGVVVAKHKPITGSPIILVRWGRFEGTGRGFVSRHIPSALQRVQNPR